MVLPRLPAGPLALALLVRGGALGGRGRGAPRFPTADERVFAVGYADDLGEPVELGEPGEAGVGAARASAVAAGAPRPDAAAALAEPGRLGRRALGPAAEGAGAGTTGGSRGASTSAPPKACEDSSRARRSSRPRGGWLLAAPPSLCATMGRATSGRAGRDKAKPINQSNA